MSLKLTSPHKSRERILAFGGAGSGKTYNWFQIANHTPDTTHLFVLDTDSTVMPYLESEEFSHLDGRLEYVDAQWIDWPDWVKTVKNWQSIARPDDWLVVDMFGHAWEVVQDYFSDYVFGKGTGEFFLQHRKEAVESGKKGSPTPFDGFTDWVAIKKLYRELVMPIVRWPGHVYLTAGKKDIIVDKQGNSAFESRETMAMYGDIKAKPATEKTADHIVRTVLFHYASSGAWRVVTTKDRQRQRLDKAKIENFAKDYLLRLAGWRPVVGGSDA